MFPSSQISHVLLPNKQKNVCAIHNILYLSMLSVKLESLIITHTRHNWLFNLFLIVSNAFTRNILLNLLRLFVIQTSPSSTLCIFVIDLTNQTSLIIQIMLSSIDAVQHSPYKSAMINIIARA